MADSDAEFWLTAASFQRSALYDTFNRIVKKHDLNWDDALEAALGRVVGASYKDNFSRDLNRKSDYPKLYAYLCTVDPEEVRKLDDRTAVSDFWDRFVAKYRTYGALDNRPALKRDYRDGMSQGNPSYSGVPYQPYYPLEMYARGQMVPLYGYAVRMFDQRVFPVPLHLPGEAPHSRSIVRIEPGEQIIATSALLPPITNEQRVGFNRFICILCDLDIAQSIAELCDVQGPLPKSVLEEIPGMVFNGRGHWAIYELSLHVTERNWIRWEPGSDTPIQM